MEEYQYKLSQNNPVLALNGISSLVAKIRLLHTSTNQNDFQKHYKYLRDIAINGQNSLATSAILGLIELTNEPGEIVPLHVLLTDMMSTVSNIKNLSGIIELIFYALFKLPVVAYDIMKNQHPLITILKRDQNCWPLILCRIEDKFRSEAKFKVLQRLQPFALYVLYDYEKRMDQVLQLAMLQIYRQYLDNTTQQKIIVLNLPHIVRSLRYCKVLLAEVPQMTTYVIAAIYTLLKHEEDVTEAIWVLHEYLMQHPKRDYALEALMIADCIPLTPVVHLNTLCECLELMLFGQKYPTIVTNTIKASLLPWKMHYATSFQLITDKASPKIDQLLTRQFEYSDVELHTFPYLDEKQFIYSYLLANELTVEFLDKLIETPPHLLETCFSVLLGAFNDHNDIDVTQRLLNVCLKCCELQAKLTTRMLPVLLHKLSKSLEPDVQMSLLRALPKLGVLKENLATVVMTIKAVSIASLQMHAFAVSLMYDLVMIERICFPYLEELLTQEASGYGEHELAITKTFIVKELCRNISSAGLENYRKELASYVSKMLICTNQNNLSVTFAFDALKYLCQGIDPLSTYANLSSRFANDSRERVIIGMCGIMSEISSIPDLNEQKCQEIIERLFAYVETAQSEAVLAAVYKALANFTMDQLALGFPAKYSAISNDNSILGSIAGACWINLLQHAPRAGLHAAADMLIQFIHIDFRTYKRNVYEGDGHGEPLYMTLTRDNVVAAVAKHVKKNSTLLATADRQVYAECLRVLSAKYKRPLPPIDWTFLNELHAQQDMREHCITIASHQSSVSGSARRFMEQAIKVASEQTAFSNDIVYIYDNLAYLCNTIQPVMLKPFFKNTLKLALSLQMATEVDFMLEKLGEIMKDANVSESNQSSAADVLMNILEGYEIDAEVFAKILPVIGSAPMQYLNESCLVHFENVDERIFMRCLAIRCAAVAADEHKPFLFLDNIIDCRVLKAAVQPNLNFEETINYLSPIFLKHRNHQMLAPWLNELSVKIQLELADKREMKNVMFACTVLSIAVIAASGYDTFNNKAKTLDEYLAVLPFAMSQLLNTKPFSSHISQFLESMYDFATNANYKRNTLSDCFADKFKHALLLMRTHETFNEKFNWMKYVEVNV